MPALREKVSKRLLNPDHPVWLADDDFDIDRHVRRIRLSPPGGAAALAEICGGLAGLPLDRRRPLWEMWVIEDPAGSRRLTVLMKVHHAAADGVTFSNLLSLLCSENPESPLPDPVAPPIVANSLRETLDGLVRFACRPLHLAFKVVPAAVAAVVDAVRRAAAGRAMAAPFSAPRTTLNARFTSERTIAFARLDLGDAKKVKDHFGVTVNDLVAALVGGAVRQLLIDRGELPRSSLVALEPVSVHGRSDSTARNQVSGMLVSLQTQIADPVERLMAVARANTIAKEQVSAMRPTLLMDFGEVVGPVLLGIAKMVYARLTEFRPMYNLIVSNVPGPNPARYFLGAAVGAMYPFGPLLLGAGLNVTLWSVNGNLHIGLTSCPAVIPDLTGLAHGLESGLTELLTGIGELPTALAAV